MKNFPIKDTDGKVYWVSRSAAISTSIFCKNDLGEWCVLAVKRGSGCPDFNGYWCLPCGYVDYDETLCEASCREAFEETGIQLLNSAYEPIFYGISSDPKDNRQNITSKFYTILPGITGKYINMLTSIYSEPDEVADIKFIKVNDLDNYKWAFNNDKIARDIYDHVVNVTIIKKWLIKVLRKWIGIN